MSMSIFPERVPRALGWVLLASSLLVGCGFVNQARIKVTCTTCGGHGLCNLCGGSGKPIFYGKCGNCEGSGRCQSCSGTGFQFGGN